MDDNNVLIKNLFIKHFNNFKKIVLHVSNPYVRINLYIILLFDLLCKIDYLLRLLI